MPEAIVTPFETLKTYVKTYRAWVAGGASVLVFALILLLARGVGSADMALLYSGLDDQTAGEVIAALETKGATYEVRGASIFVTAAERDILRLQLAGEGLPRTTTQGYELLDSLSGFGTTAQMFDAAYWRAKEGELARTILASPNIRAARVHISSSNARPFGRTADVSAAVTVTTNGMAPAAKQVQSLQFLVAAAVAGLSPDDVAIIDSSGGLLSGETNDFGNDRAAALRDNVLRLLEAHVGFGNAV
ncbi:MAG: flagellar M-ring protein FliF, partial [Rhodobacteraceae bacterium]|nr:flagellar M-ring protein FliF [Paracoccaceae bacterium]